MASDACYDMQNKRSCAASRFVVLCAPVAPPGAPKPVLLSCSVCFLRLPDAAPPSPSGAVPAAAACRLRTAAGLGTPAGRGLCDGAALPGLMLSPGSRLTRLPGLSPAPSVLPPPPPRAASCTCPPPGASRALPAGPVIATGEWRPALAAAGSSAPSPGSSPTAPTAVACWDVCCVTWPVPSCRPTLGRRAPGAATRCWCCACCTLGCRGPAAASAWVGAPVCPMEVASSAVSWVKTPKLSDTCVTPSLVSSAAGRAPNRSIKREASFIISTES